MFIFAPWLFWSFEQISQNERFLQSTSSFCQATTQCHFLIKQWDTIGTDAREVPLCLQVVRGPSSLPVRGELQVQQD